MEPVTIAVLLFFAGLAYVVVRLVKKSKEKNASGGGGRADPSPPEQRK